MKKYILYIFCFAFLIPLTGCTVAMKMTGVQQLQDQVNALSAKVDKMNEKISQIEKNQKEYQVQNQANLMAVSSKLDGEINDTKTGFNESLNQVNSQIDSLSKTQYKNDIEYNKSLDIFKKSYNDTMTTLNAFNSTMLEYQNSLMSLRDSVQQITQNMNILNSEQSDLNSEMKQNKKEFNDKLQIMLSQLTNQESQIVSLENKSNTQTSSSTPSVKTISGSKKIYTVYNVKSGDTLLNIANKFNVSLRKLLELNKMTSNSIIFPGQKIIIP